MAAKGIHIDTEAVPTLLRMLGVGGSMGDGGAALTDAAQGDPSGLSQPAVEPPTEAPTGTAQPSPAEAQMSGDIPKGIPSFIRAAMDDSGGSADPVEGRGVGLTKLAALHRVLAGGGTEPEPSPDMSVG